MTYFSLLQIEGAWLSDGKALGIWDKTTHTPGLVAVIWL